MVWNWDLLAFIGLWGIMNGNTSVLTVLYLAKLRRIFVHLQGGFSTA